MPAFNKYQCFAQDVGRKVHNLHTDALAIALTNTAPNASTHALLSDITEIGNGNGYTSGAGTLLLASISYVGTAGVGKLLANDPVITAAAGTIGPFRYWVLYNSTPSSPLKPLIGWWDRGAALTLQDTETFTVDLDGTNGILTLT